MQGLSTGTRVEHGAMALVHPEEIRPRVRLANDHVTRVRQTWGPRTIPDLQFIAVIKGHFSYQDGRVCLPDLAPGDVLCIEPGIEHTFAGLGRSEGRISGMHLELAEGNFADGDYQLEPSPARITRIDEPAPVLAAFRRCAEIFNGYHRHREALCAAIATEAILLLASAWTGTAGLERSPRLREMLAFVRERAVIGCDRHALARAFSVTPEHVNWLFRRELGMTPREVVNRERCAVAFRLLQEQGIAVAEASAQAGFSDPYYFSRVFSRLYGRPPSQYR